MIDFVLFVGGIIWRPLLLGIIMLVGVIKIK